MKKLTVKTFEDFMDKFVNHDLDVVNELFKHVKIALVKNKKKIQVFSIYCTDTEMVVKLSIDKDEFPKVLNGCMNAYIKNEMYEECSQIKSILEILNKKQS